MSKLSDASQSGPFGMADGAAEDREKFIRFANHGSWGDLSFSETSLRERFFVGRRGSGKSRYLREQERAAAKKMLVFPQQTDAVSITHLRRLHTEFNDPAEREEIWIRLWHAATNLALGSYLLTSPEVDGTSLAPDDRNSLTDLVTQNLGFAIAPFPVVSALNQLLQSTNAQRSKLTERLNRPDWTVLEHLVAKLVGVSKPVAMFIDSLDENFRDAPAENSQAQLSLLLQLARTLTDPTRTNRPHLFVTVRDVIYSQFLAHEQGEKYANDVHWKLLDWRKSAARFFFEEKIKRLAPLYLRQPQEKSNLFLRWLGVSHIHNPQRGVEEEVGDFLLRHTRFLPREVVEIGNALCNATLARNEARIDIWSLVIKQAEHIGERALQVIFDHIVALSDNAFTSVRERMTYRKLIESAFIAFRATIATEVFSRKVMVAADDAFLEVCSDPELTISFSNLLWQHGLVGYMYADEARGFSEEIALFYHAVDGTEGSSSYQLPTADRYRLHASLVNGGRVELDQRTPIVDSLDAVL